ncbi:unnamed protein product [Auanema sp. JU1783]|nr:unnamed protein product [Auanema sp. JU1783]
MILKAILLLFISNVLNANFTEYLRLRVTIENSKCQSSSTESAFTFFLTTLSRENKFLGWYPIHKKDFVKSKEKFEIEIYRDNSLRSSHPTNIGQCFEEEYDSDVEIVCVPTADAFFVYYQNDPVDTWSIGFIKVYVDFFFNNQSYQWYFEYTPPAPCSSYMNDEGFYQIGPRPGIFIKWENVTGPQIGDWIRDWV